MTTSGRGALQRAVWLTAVLLATRAAEASYDVRSVAAIIGGRPIVELNDHKKAVFVPIDTASVSQLGEANPSDRCIATACWAICHPKAPDVVTTAAQRHDAQCSKMWQKVGVFEVADALRAEDTFASYSHLLAGAQLHTLPREFWRLAYFEPTSRSLVVLADWEIPVAGYPMNAGTLGGRLGNPKKPGALDMLVPLFTAEGVMALLRCAPALLVGKTDTPSRCVLPPQRHNSQRHALLLPSPQIGRAHV